jgi:hypothetical protein
MDNIFQISKAMVKTKYPDFDQVFDDDPMFALVFRSKSFDTTPSIVFCEFTQRRGIKIEKVALPFLPAACDFTPTELLKQQLDAIKCLLRPETDALQFSAISRELVKARSSFKHEKQNKIPMELCNGSFHSFDILHVDAWAKSDFKEIVSDLAQIVFSELWVDCKLFQKSQTKVITITSYNDMLVWVKDDESILALIMPERFFLDVEERFTFDKCWWQDDSRTMKLLTWNEMFDCTEDVRVNDAGVVFLILDDMIRYVYYRNINADPDGWKNQKRNVIVCMPDDLYQRYFTFARQINMMYVRPPYIANGTRLRELVRRISHSVDRQLLPTNIKLILCVVLDALFHKNKYNLDYGNKIDHNMNMCKEWFDPDKLRDLISAWTAFVSGQESCTFKNEKFSGSAFSIYEVRMHDRVMIEEKTVIKRSAYWQFIPQKEMVSVFEAHPTYKGTHTTLAPEDMPGNCFDLRAQSTTKETCSRLLMRINTLPI